jgi:hypothetical protein
MEHAQEEDLLTLLLRVSQEIRAYSTTQVLVLSFPNESVLISEYDPDLVTMKREKITRFPVSTIAYGNRHTEVAPPTPPPPPSECVFPRELQRDVVYLC